MPYDDAPNPTLTGDEALLQEIRDRFRYACDAWREIRDERRIDMRYIAGDPWDEADRKARADAGRPCINHDELNQFVNQAINGLRQNKRGIKVSPAGNGASEKTAELHQDLIRTIEYRSQAQSAYVTAFQAALEGSYGFFRLSRKYTADSDNLTAENFDRQEIVVRNIANPDSVLYDPDCKEADWCDARFCFVLNPISRDEFKAQYPNAQVKDFTAEHMAVAKDWLQEKLVLTAEYWKVESKPRTLYLLATGEVTDALPEDEKPVKQRTVQAKKVVQYITNGVEILERNEEIGGEIPVLIVTGKEIYVDEGSGGAKRKLLSLVRLARDPQMSLAHLVSQQTEEAGLSPRVPYVGYKGQFESDAEAWETATKVPHAFLQVDPVVDAAGGALLPLPRREPFTPNFAAFEVAKDSCRRAIQAAMGISPLPTAMQRNSEKSGVALERIQQQQAIGSFHFIDNFDRALTRAGRIMESWIPSVYGDERETAVVKPDDSHELVRLNAPPDETQEQAPRVDEGDHDVTISTGPSFESQRSAQQDFLDTLIANLGSLPVAPPQAAKLLSMAIQMKQLGPKGDEMAEIISPREQEGQQMPPQALQAMQQAEQQMQALNAYAQDLEGKLKEMEAEKQAKVVENEYRLKIETLKIEADLAKAEITTKAQDVAERLRLLEDTMQKLQAMAHEAGMQAAQHAHESAQSEAQRAHDAQMGAPDPSPEHEARETPEQEAQEHATGLEVQDE